MQQQRDGQIKNRTRPKTKTAKGQTERSPSPSPSSGAAVVPPGEQDGRLPAALIVAGLIAVVVAGVVFWGLGGSASGAREISDRGEQLSEFVASIRRTSWGEGTPLAKKLQHSLARPPKGSAGAEGIRSFVIGGDLSTAAHRSELLELLGGWVGGRSRCPAEHSWRLDANGRSMDAQAAEALYEQLASTECAAILIVLSSAEQIHMNVMQVFEPLLSGEGPALETEVFLAMDVEIPADGADEASTCPAQRGSKRYKCMEQQLQEWISSSVWKRKGFQGRITQWIPLG